MHLFVSIWLRDSLIVSVWRFVGELDQATGGEVTKNEAKWAKKNFMIKLSRMVSKTTW